MIDRSVVHGSADDSDNRFDDDSDDRFDDDSDDRFSSFAHGEESYKYSARRGHVLRGNYPAPRRENSSPRH